MSIADPSDLLAEIDMDLFDQYRHYSRKAPAKTASDSSSPVIYVEPGIDASHANGAAKNSSSNGVKKSESEEQPTLLPITSKVVTLGDYIDTDAVNPPNFPQKRGWPFTDPIFAFSSHQLNTL